MNEGLTSNIAFAGLTAAGKTTHARRLAAELAYDYVSATDILLELLDIQAGPLLSLKSLAAAGTLWPTDARSDRKPRYSRLAPLILDQRAGV